MNIKFCTSGVRTRINCLDRYRYWIIIKLIFVIKRLYSES